ncbi:MAG: YicC/YloC family endoribonuclease [Desulfobacterales bacterium]
MVKSMTAFSQVEQTEDGLTVAIEIRSYNSKNLDIALHMPHAYRCFEEEIKKTAAARIERGRVTIRFEMRIAGGEPEYEIDEPRALAYYRALSRLKETLGLDGEISLDQILAGGEVITPIENEMDMEKYGEVIHSCLAEALEDFDAMRQREGDFLSNDFKQRLDELEAYNEQIAQGSGNLLDHYQASLKERIALLTHDTVALDMDRVTQEAAFLADKSDVSEEVVRVRSHIEQFRSIMDGEDPAGRKLNFLLQELNREFNTIGSKTGNASVPYRIVDAKSEIEKIREQVQNVE